MSEEEPQESIEDEVISEEVIKEAIAQIINLILSNESYSGHLSEDERNDLIGGLKELSFLDPRLSDEPESAEYMLESLDTIGEIYGMLEQFSVDAEKIMREVGLTEQ